MENPVCPGDYILEYEDGRIDVVSQKDFETKYEPWIPCDECSMGCGGEECKYYEEFMKDKNGEPKNT